MHDSTYFLLKIVKNPHVMITNKIVYLNTVIAEFGQLAEDAGVTFWYYIFICKPKVEYISQKNKRMHLGSNTVKKSNKLLFSFDTISALPQMCIGEKKYFFSHSDIIASHNRYTIFSVMAIMGFIDYSYLV